MSRLSELGGASVREQSAEDLMDRGFVARELRRSLEKRCRLWVFSVDDDLTLTELQQAFPGHVHALGPHSTIDLEGCCAGEAVDALCQITGVRCLAKSDAIHDAKLLQCEVLVLVDHHSAEVVPIQLNDLVMGEDQLSEPRQIVVSEAALGDPVAFDLQGVSIPRG